MSLYNYDSRFQESFDRAQRQYDYLTPESYALDEYDTVEMTEEEWADLGQNEPDWDSESENW